MYEHYGYKNRDLNRKMPPGGARALCVHLKISQKSSTPEWELPKHSEVLNRKKLNPILIQAIYMVIMVDRVQSGTRKHTK